MSKIRRAQRAGFLTLGRPPSLSRGHLRLLPGGEQLQTRAVHDRRLHPQARTGDRGGRLRRLRLLPRRAARLRGARHRARSHLRRHRRGQRHPRPLRVLQDRDRAARLRPRRGCRGRDRRRLLPLSPPWRYQSSAGGRSARARGRVRPPSRCKAPGLCVGSPAPTAAATDPCKYR